MTAFAYYRLPYLHHAHYVAQREGEPEVLSTVPEQNMVLPVPTATVGVLLTMARQLLSVLLKIGLHGSLTWMAPRLLSIQPTMVMVL